jgi:hypothetical protein
MKNLYWKALSLTCICAVFMVVGPTDTFAYGTFGGGCKDCHNTGDEFDGPGEPLHDLHNTFASSCFRCHNSTGDNPVTSLTADTPLDRGCVGCHGRSEDAGNDGLGAGLRQHHYNSGQTVCAGCHTDANPSNYTPVGEDVFPPFYIDEDLLPCEDTLDNDGDNTYDEADSDCIQIIEDSDCDGIADSVDNCPDTGNSNQLDADGDSIGDVCDNDPGCGNCGEDVCEVSFSDKVEELLTHYYLNILGRAPAESGLNYWTDEIMSLNCSGGDIKEGFISVAQSFFNSQEYLGRDRDDEEYVTDLYNTFFNREPDSVGFDYWTSQLSQGANRNDLLDYFVYSTEFNDFMDELFGLE